MYINILFIIILLVIVFIIAKQDTHTKAIKGFVITMLLLTVAIAMLFEYSHTKADENSRPIINAFKQGKTLHCAENDITQKNYSYEPGTSSFQPRINVVGETFSLYECSIK